MPRCPNRREVEPSARHAASPPWQPHARRALREALRLPAPLYPSLGKWGVRRVAFARKYTRRAAVRAVLPTARSHGVRVQRMIGGGGGEWQTPGLWSGLGFVLLSDLEEITSPLWPQAPSPEGGT